jgi:RND family efflux transporter MFP subunit
MASSVHGGRGARHARGAALVALAILTTVGCGGPEKGPGEEAAAPVDVRTRLAEPVSWQAYSEVTAGVEPLRRAAPATTLMGRVDAILQREGDRVAAGDTLALIESEAVAAQLAQAEAAVAAVRAGERNALLMKERMERLHSRQSASQKNVDDAVAAWEAAAAQLHAAEEGVNAARVQVEHSSVKAPFAGLVTRRNVEVGDMAAPGSPLFVIEDVSKMKIEAQVPESALAGLQPGEPAEVRIDAVPDPIRSGTLTEILPAGDPRSRTFTVRIVLGNPGGRLRSGMFARLLLSGDTREAIAVPEGAIVRRGPLAGVFLVDEGSTARLRWITLGEDRDGMVEVLSGLTSGERYVESPLEGLVDGRKVIAR